MSWAELPPAPVTRTRPPVLAAVIASVVPITIEASRLTGDAGRPWVVAAAGLLALAVAGALPTWAPVAHVGAGVALALLLGGADGVKVAGLVTVGGLLWGVGLGVVRWAPGHLRDGVAFRPSLVPLAVADLALVVGPTLRVPAAIATAAVVLAGVGLIAPGRTVAAWSAVVGSPVGSAARAVSRGVDVIAGAVSKVILWIALVPGAVTVLVIWAIQTVVRHDPLAAPTPRPGQWVVRSGADPYPSRYYSSGSSVDQRSPWARLAAVGSPLLAASLIAGLVLLSVDREPRRPVSLTVPLPSTTGCADLDTSESVTGDDVLDCETGAALSRLEFYAPSVFRIADFAGETVNEIDGVRRTWKPPACGCRRLDVWWFGGSAAWGEGQSDLHTLPSELARAAFEEGVALDISNFGQTTYTLGQEVRMFSDLTTRRPAPDLVVFYDGGNDLVFQAQRARSGLADDESPIVLVEDQLDDLISDGFPVAPNRSTTTQPPPPDVTDELVERTATAAMNRYGRDADLARRIGASIDTPVAIVFQPLLAGSPAAAAVPGALPADERDVFRRLIDAARPLLPDKVVDLSDAFADTDEPVFIDLFHTNERGAELLGRRLADRLRPTIEAALARPARAGDR